MRDIKMSEIGDRMEADLTHNSLEFLETLKKYTLDSKLMACQKMSSRLMTCSKVDMDYAVKENVMPWEIEAFAAYSIVFNSDEATEELDANTFGRIITLIRNYWHNGLVEAEKEGTYPEIFFMISALQQFPVQGVFLQKLFRYNYFFTFKNDVVDMRKELFDKMGVTYEQLEEFAYLVFMLSSKEAMDTISHEDLQRGLTVAFSDSKVFNLLKIEENDYRRQLQGLYKDSLIDQYYGLKIQYLYPFISGKDNTYIPSPYLVINAVTESMLNRFTYNDDVLRRKLGKEVIENYVFDIINDLPTVTWISREIEYYKGRAPFLSPDILAAEDNNVVFYDTKAISPSLKLRKFDKQEIEGDIEIYAGDVKQIYSRINDYLDGLFQLNKDYAKENIFGIVVVLEDANISRKRIYDKAFSLIEKTIELSDADKKYICSHIKILPLRSIENKVLENSSIIPPLLEQVDKPEKWFDYEYSSQTICDNGIPIYESYVNDIKGRVSKKLNTISKG